MKIPVATYRLQFRNGMDFDRAISILPYLKRLGVSHLYASPIFTAIPGSTHGYDVVDCNQIDPAIGGHAGFERLDAALKEHGLGLILDIVPNHMAASLENVWWRSVVEWGEQSPFARHFDIDWSERLTLPVLGRSFAECLEQGEITLALDHARGCAALRYSDHLYPLHPASYEEVFSRFSDPLAQALTRRAALAAPDEDGWHAEIRQLAADCATQPLEAEMARRSRDPDFLSWIHGEQAYRLIFWQEAARHLSYRRFFEVTGLVGMRVEDEHVFDDTHRLILRLMREGRVEGLRVDHVDGLADPTAYLEKLRDAAGPESLVLVEKILEPGETLPASWPVQGTTGYEFIADLAGLFADAGGLERLGRCYADVEGRDADFSEEYRTAKHRMLTKNFAGEFTRLANLCVEALAERDGNTPSPEEVASAIDAIAVAFPVYRTYGGEDGMPQEGRELIDKVLEEASADGAGPVAVADLLEGGTSRPATEFRMRFQQLTGAIMAKAVEDTLFYRYNRLIALNEVGGDPHAIPGGVEAFHRRMEERVRLQPFGLSATATHDTKRGEDTRARLYVLTESAGEWCAAIDRWRTMNAQAVRQLSEGPAPEPEAEWLIYQALAGAWPEGLRPRDQSGLDSLHRRFSAYLRKALREAKRRTNWTDVNADYEAAVEAYAGRLFASPPFLADFIATLAPVIRAGHLNSLSQTLLKLTAPGIPDVYQGSEMRDLSLVDPDNRITPDYAALERGLRRGALPPLSDPYRLKQELIGRCLAERARNPALFTCGRYVPLRTGGARAANLIAFLRLGDDAAAMVLAPRLATVLLSADGDYGADIWADTTVELPLEILRGEALTDILTGRRFECVPTLHAATLLQELPLALLVMD